MGRVRSSVWTCVVVALVGVVPDLHAQSGSAQLAGVVRDGEGAVVPGATVRSPTWPRIRPARW